MADRLDQADIRTLDTDATVKGFALVEYKFKNLCTVTSTSGDSIRWYQETAADLTATSPAAIANIGRLEAFTNLEHTWTRNTSYPRKYGAETMVSFEDMKLSDIDVMARMLLRLTRAVVEEVDKRIWNVMTESQSAVNINSVTSTAAWDAASGQDPIEDIMEAKQDIWESNYDADSAVLLLSPKDYKSLVTWLISSKGANIPGFSSDQIVSASVTNILGLKVMVMSEFIAQPNNTIGYVMLQEKNFLEMDYVFAWTIILVVFVLLVEELLKIIKTKL